MAKVQLCNITVMDNPTSFLNPFQFEITFECIEELGEDLEWKLTYVGSSESEKLDQVLEAVFVGPVPEGKHMFIFQANPPDVSRIPENDAIDVTVAFLTCSYRTQLFIRVGYFIYNEYSDPELRENPPSPPQFENVIRNILASEPRITRFKINWDDQSAQDNLTNGEKITTNGDEGMDNEVNELNGASNHDSSINTKITENTSSLPQMEI